MPVITRALLRKRAEHNEGMISTLEEITLHQEELESINEVLGMTCRKIKILYLQNNIIPKMENLMHLKELVYLNLALNNIRKIEGLQNCEFLQKLDLTVNFIDVDTLKESIDHLVARNNLTELYMMGNPAQATWDKFNIYVIAKLPQLKTLDGTEVTKSMQILARQSLVSMEVIALLHIFSFCGLSNLMFFNVCCSSRNWKCLLKRNDKKTTRDLQKRRCAQQTHFLQM
jgi:protein TilB